MITTTDVLGKGFDFLVQDVVDLDDEGEEVVRYFTWRPNTGKMPCNGDLWVEYKGNNGIGFIEKAKDIQWHLTPEKSSNGAYYAIVKWRPSMRNWESGDIKEGGDYPANQQLKKTFLPYEDCYLEGIDTTIQDNEAAEGGLLQVAYDLYLSFTNEGNENASCYSFNSFKDLPLANKWLKIVNMTNSSKVEQPKPKRTKTGYVQVTESIFDLKEEFERGELWMHVDICNGGYYKSIGCEEHLVEMMCSGNVHRKVETEITEREVFIEAAIDIFENTACKQVYDMKGGFAALFDAGCRFVEGK